jgi:2'-5' RNA ligase
MRLFIAIELSDEVKEILSGLRSEIPGVRWVPSEQMHLTLLFLGEIAQDQLETLCNALAAISINPFTLTFDRTGCFPRPASPRVLWAGVERQEVLERLVRLVSEASSACGIQTEERSFSPHITMGRIKEPTSCNVANFINRPVNDRKLSVQVRSFILYKSSLTQQGAIHEVVREFPL